MFCSKCGKELPSSVTYCKYCGNKNENSAYFAKNIKSSNTELSHAAQIKETDKAYLICAAFVFISLIALFLSWFSFSLSVGDQFFWSDLEKKDLGDLTIFEAVSRIWNITFSVVGNNIGSREFQSVLQGYLLCTLLIGIAWLCAVGYCAVALLSTLKRQTIFEVHLFGAFLWTIAVSLSSVILVVFSLSVSQVFSNSDYLIFFPHLFPEQGLWIALISSVCGFVFYRQKRNDLVWQQTDDISCISKCSAEPVCPLCGFMLPDIAQFCPCCGLDLGLANLENQKFCPNCNCIVGESESTCGYCGTKQ